MPLPNFTPEQQAENRAKAAAARSARADLRQQVKDGKLSIVDVLAKSDDPIAAKTKVTYLLESLPGYGKAKVAKLMEELDIHASRKVGGLGAVQRQALIKYFSE